MQVQERSTITTRVRQIANSTPSPVNAPLAWTGIGQEFTNRWDAARDTISNWLQHPDYFCDEESESPNQHTIESGINIAETMKRVGHDPPDRVIVTAEGGIAFEWRDGNTLMRFELYPDGQLDQTSFENSQLTNHLQSTIVDYLSEFRSLYLTNVDYSTHLMSY